METTVKINSNSQNEVSFEDLLNASFAESQLATVIENPDEKILVIPSNCNKLANTLIYIDCNCDSFEAVDNECWEQVKFNLQSVSELKVEITV